MREGSPQTAEFTTTYTPANPVYVTAVYFQNRTTPSNRRTDVNQELFYGGQTILICWRQKNTETNGNVLYINGNWYKGYGNPNYREVEYVLPESGGNVLIEISDTWWPNGIDGKITVKLKEENPLICEENCPIEQRVKEAVQWTISENWMKKNLKW